ncbi:YidC/Oxa1 family membrane protein insertase [candidate division WWE3 bacterium]|uniref:YidC/Oxa1 family membrane protein insertase n=1 Tax=candidate division WWE3 bacterium TaxID=2053526 RepID=A0A7X9DL76_UNCKA|nr:YidC/Oxa1 family membrane protein insertase [candidate division WWE3 bacterium]
MLAFIWNNILVNPILNGLVALYQIFGSLGISIIILTLIIRGILVPVVAPSLKAMKKQRDLQPEINKLKEKYSYDKQLLAQKQMELFKQHGINPMSGCLNQVIMILVLIALYNVIRKFTLNGTAEELNNGIYFTALKFAEGTIIPTKFLYLDLAKPDPYFGLALLSGLLQFIASKMTIPYVELAEKAAEKTPAKSDDIAMAMQQQSLYMMPIMNVIIGVTLPAGVVLYILTTTLFTIVQNYFISGLGGLKPWVAKAKKLLRKNK